MNTLEVVKRLRAHAAGQPLPAGETRQTPVAPDDDRMHLAFVRMGGESLPWALGYQVGGGDPVIFAVPEARNRDLVAAMLAEFTPMLLAHVQHPEFTGGKPDSNSPPDEVPLRQVWLPTPAHVQMLHLLNARYTFAKRGENEARLMRLNALGRACGWLFRTSQLPAQATVIDATAALRSAFTFPVDDLRQQHLGFLLALLGGASDEELEAEERTSVSITLDPVLEGDDLEPLVEKYGNAVRAKRDTRALEEAIAAILEEEVRRRLDLTARAVNVLALDPRRLNAGTAQFVEAAAKSWCREYARLEEKLADGEWAYVPDSETDHNASGAAAGYFAAEESADLAGAAFVHDDCELQAGLIASGDALRGTIVDLVDEGQGKMHRPVWTVDAPGSGPLRLRVGSTVCVAGLAKRTGKIRAIEILPDGNRRFEIALTGLFTRPNGPGRLSVPLGYDADLIGTPVTWLGGSAGGFGLSKRSRVWRSDGPGAWLTHQKGAPPATPGPSADVLAEVDALRASA